MQARRPALRLPDLRPRLFQRLALEVVALQKPALLLRQLLDGCPHPHPLLLELQPLIHRQGLVRETQRVCTFEAGREHHRQSRHRVGDVHYIIVNGPPAVASSLLAIRKISQIRGGPLTHVGGARIAPLEHSHLAQAIVDGALDAVVGKGEEVGSYLGIKAIGRLQEANLAVGDELVELELGGELPAHGRRQRPHVGAVLLQENLLVFAEPQAPLTQPSTTTARGPDSNGDHPAGRRRSCWSRPTTSSAASP